MGNPISGDRPDKAHGVRFDPCCLAAQNFVLWAVAGDDHPSIEAIAHERHRVDGYVEAFLFVEPPEAADHGRALRQRNWVNGRELKAVRDHFGSRRQVFRG